MVKDRHIWEGWSVNSFIQELEPQFDTIMDNSSWQRPFQSDAELKRWCIDNQPYYKKHIPEVFNYCKGKMKQFKQS